MDNWISVNSHLPKPEEEVRLFCKTKYGNTTYQCQGFYIPEKMDAEESDYNWDWDILEYDDENDVNYVQSGWYERIHNWDDYSAVYINDEILYWMPSPKNPEGWE